MNMAQGARKRVSPQIEIMDSEYRSGGNPLAQAFTIPVSQTKETEFSHLPKISELGSGGAGIMPKRP